MIALFWPFVLLITVVLYGGILVFLPFSTTLSTLMLFTLVGFWSRLPGVGIPHPFFILVNMDLIDLFTVIIAVNVSPFHAIVYSLFCNLVSRACGTFPDWGAVISDAVTMAILCIFTPLIYGLSGSSIVLTLLIFTIIRAFLWIPLDLVFWPQPFVKYTIIWFGGVGSLLVINSFYGHYFGGFFDSLLEQGVQFSWVLFLLVTVVIGIFYFTFRKGKVIPSGFVRNIRRIIRGKKKKRRVPIQRTHDDVRRYI